MAAVPSRPQLFAQFHGEDAFARLEPQEWQALGIDNLVLRVFRNQSEQGGVLFNNPEFRVVKPLLRPFLSKMNDSGPAIWGWMIARRFDWLKDPRYLDRQSTGSGLEVIPRLDLFNPGAVKRIVAVYGDLAQSGITGIMIQDDLVLRSREGLSSWGRAKFSLETGIPAQISSMLDPRYGAHAHWVEFKNRQVAMVLARIVDRCKSQNPNIQVGLNLYYETPLQPKKSRNWYAHDLDLLLGTGIDRVFLMAYHRQIAAELGLSTAAAIEFFGRLIRQAMESCQDKLVVKVQCRDWKTGAWLPDSELDAILDRIPPGVGGICLTPVSWDDLPRVQRLLARRGWRADVSREKR